MTIDIQECTVRNSYFQGSNFITNLNLDINNETFVHVRIRI